MARRRLTPDEDVERLSERIWHDAQGRIRDMDSFDDAFDEYMLEGIPKLTPKQDTQLRSRAFGFIRENHPEVSKLRLFRKAKGKDFARDKRKRAKTIVTTEREYIKRTAPRVDLKDYDMPRVSRRKQFNVVGRVRGKVVYARRTFVFVEGKKRLRYRDMRGRFVSVKRKV